MRKSKKLLESLVLNCGNNEYHACTASRGLCESLSKNSRYSLTFVKFIYTKMRKRKQGRKLSRKRDQRKALLRGLASSLILHERIETTEAKAKEAKGITERFITKAKKQSLATRRALLGVLPERTVKKLMGELAKRYENRPGGYTRIIKLGPRKSDGAKMVIIELVE